MMGKPPSQRALVEDIYSLTLPASPPGKPLAVLTPPNLFRGMNKTEERRAIELEALKRSGEITLWMYEAVTLKLADDTRYTPDFFVMLNDGTIRFEETKGFLRDDALVKIKVAAALFPFRFVMYTARAKKDGGGWEVRDFTA